VHREPAQRRRDARAIARRIQSGSVCVNDVLVNFVVTDVPMGGWKESGLGYRHGAGGIRKFCAQQTVVVGSGWKRKLLAS
jgi:acyl-CoA reductase-like NAD-dependent aldehyde dehydrogenase